MVPVSSLMYVLSDGEIMDDLRSIYKGKSNMLTKAHIQSSEYVRTYVCILLYVYV